MLFNLHFHITTNMAVNFQYLQSQAWDLKFAWACCKNKALICKIPIYSCVQISMFLNICFYLFFSWIASINSSPEFILDLAVPLIFLFCCVHSLYHWSSMEVSIKKCPTTTRACQRFLSLFTLNNQPNNGMYKVSNELISENICAFFLKR